jgi:hypothetical protein
VHTHCWCESVKKFQQNAAKVEKREGERERETEAANSPQHLNYLNLKESD